jgi:hypothetical protein
MLYLALIAQVGEKVHAGVQADQQGLNGRVNG